MPQDSPNRRTRPRYSIEAAVDLETDNNLYAGVSYDIGEGGVFVATHVPPPQGATVHLRLILTGEEPLEMDGVVRWIRSVAASCEGMPPGCGIEWQTIPDAARGALERFMAARDPILYDD